MAIQSARNTDPRRGLHADAELPECFPGFSLAKVILFADFATRVLLLINQLNPAQVTPTFEGNLEPDAHNLQGDFLRYHPLAE